MKVAYCTRLMTQELYELSSSSWGNPFFKRETLSGCEALEYFEKSLDLEDVDWVVNLDEDVFLTNPDAIPQLIKHMEEHGYTCAGMPDGGVCEHRFHNPLVPNAFFTILSLKALRESFKPSNWEECIHKAEWEAQFPKHLLYNKYAFDNFEPYYPFFFWLLSLGHKFLYLDALSWNRDPISTVLLDHTQKPFLIHCWYGRAFQEQKPRFLNAARFSEVVRKRRDQRTAAVSPIIP